MMFVRPLIMHLVGCELTMPPQPWLKRHGAVTHWSLILGQIPSGYGPCFRGTSNMTKMTKRGVDGHQRHPCRAIWPPVGQRIRARRLQCRHSVHRVAKELGISPDLYLSYELGETQVPALLLTQLAEFLSVPVIWFLQDGSLPEREGGHVCRVSPPTYRVATFEQRVDVLAGSFRKLDVEGQQHLLAVAAALCRTNAKESQK